jgi:hypothetical protein
VSADDGRAAPSEPRDFSGIEREIVGLEAPGARRSGWGMSPCRGVYHRPAGDPSPRVAFIAAHYNIDFSEHYLAEHLARRGHGFLGWNTRFCGAEAYFLLDRALVDIGRGVAWLRERGAEVVVALGNSGGGSLMAAYLAQATRPVVRAPYGTKLAATVDELPRADLYISLAAHAGRPEILTSWLDPAVLDESDPVPSDPELDMYEPANGPPYEPAFVQRYRAAQSTRNRAITAWAKRELERVRAAGFSDRLFALQRTWADLRFVDPAIDPSDRPTPACYQGDPRKANRGVAGLATSNTLRTWLSMWSLDDSQCRAGEHLAAIELPTLVVQATMDVGVFPSDCRAIFDGLATSDKRLVEMAGDHYFRGAPGTPRADVAQLIGEWVAAR